MYDSFINSSSIDTSVSPDNTLAVVNDKQTHEEGFWNYGINVDYRHAFYTVLEGNPVNLEENEVWSNVVFFYTDHFGTLQSYIQSVRLKSGPYFNISNLFTKIYNMLYYTTKLFFNVQGYS